MELIQKSIQNRIGCITLNRADKHNAFNPQLISELTAAIEKMNINASVDIIQINANGKNFCAGADIEHMRACADFNQQQNLQDAKQLSDLFNTLYHCPKPTLANVRGWVLGGGIGLVSCCDFAIAHDDSRFCFSEVKLGLVPATIAPFVIKKIGVNNAKRWFMTAKRFDANDALLMGLVSHVSNEQKQQQTLDELTGQLLSRGPNALRSCKQLVHTLAPVDQSTIDMTISLIANTRTSAEAQEGLSAFLEKRQPNWK